MSFGLEARSKAAALRTRRNEEPVLVSQRCEVSVIRPNEPVRPVGSRKRNYPHTGALLLLCQHLALSQSNTAVMAFSSRRSLCLAPGIIAISLGSLAFRNSI